MCTVQPLTGEIFMVSRQINNFEKCLLNNKKKLNSTFQQPKQYSHLLKNAVKKWIKNYVNETIII